MNAQNSTLRTFLRPATALLATAALAGCNVDSFFNPSVTGYWEEYPSTLPILDRIDVIEVGDDYWAQATYVTPEDLYPSDLTYRLAPSDFVTVSIQDLFGPGQGSITTRRVDAGGFIRVAGLGDMQAAGLTPEELENAVTDLLELNVIANPQVEVVLEEGAGFHYTVYGNIPGAGLYTLRDQDLRLVDAVAAAGGFAPTSKHIYVIRQVELSDDVLPDFKRSQPGPEEPTEPSPPIDIDELIQQLDREGSGPSPGVLRQDQEPVIDIQDLEPVQVPDRPVVDIDDLGRGRAGLRGEGSWIYVAERNEWVRVARGDQPAAVRPLGEPPLYLERVIKVPIERLSRGESKYNIVIRPNDRIYVKPPEIGVVYLEGQVPRAGTFNIPTTGTLTLSRLIAAAGGLGQLAIPDRVDLTRIVEENREATIRLNLGAIRHRTEPDVVLKPDDHIIVGTNWIATPLAVIRNGFRATYGFGFLLDRNFGNDVFGAPPVNRVGE